MTKEILAKDMTIDDFHVFFPVVGDNSRLLIRCRRPDYSASAICRAVEDCDAHVLNLNVTSLSDNDIFFVVALRVDRRSTESIIRSLARYGYDVIEAETSGDSSEDIEETSRRRALELLRYLEI